MKDSDSPYRGDGCRRSGCGHPFGRSGAIPEIVKDQETGFSAKMILPGWLKSFFRCCTTMNCREDLKFDAASGKCGFISRLNKLGRPMQVRVAVMHLLGDSIPLDAERLVPFPLSFT